MKKIILLLLLVLVSITASARKSYIMMSTSGLVTGHSFSLAGEVPEGIENKGFIYDSNSHCWYSKSEMKYVTSEILNWLSEYGYEVEFMNTTWFLLSKEVPSGQTVSEGDVNKDGEVNIADINKVVALILGIIKENPSILEQIKK